MRFYKTPLSESDLREIAAALANGATALIPTDTVYGIAAHPASAVGVAKLFSLKRRDPSKPIPLLAASADAVAGCGLRLEGAALAAAKKFWPGALTLIIGGEGVRVPDSATAREICAAAGGMLRCTSANESGETPALDGVSAAAALPDADILIDGGAAKIGVASTVARFKMRSSGVREFGSSGECEVEIIREGSVGIDELRKLR